MLYTEDFTIRRDVGFLQIGSHIYLYRSLGIYLLKMIFNVVFKQVQCLFRPRHSFPSVNLDG